MERKERKEGRKEERKANLSTLAAAASFPLPCFLASFPSLFCSCFHSPFHPFCNIHFPLFPSIFGQTTETSPIVPFRENFARETAPPHQFPPSSLNVTIPFPFVSGESNVVWRWHQLNGWPLHAHSARTTEEGVTNGPPPPSPAAERRKRPQPCIGSAGIMWSQNGWIHVHKKTNKKPYSIAGG